ncbi:unnamed protein product [Allacma fusca]|uniref:LisH domain-containing protein n=1 Tax=Allacma fusca TaxID=39272 RepID=A0A8J2KXV9_9HEXA|nr:unnamed protein product [Allacma fusca]
MKSQIAQFVQSNGKTTKDNLTVNVTRLHPTILSMIYEYLRWVGMKNTCALLLCESPVQFDTSPNLDVGNSAAVPELSTYLSEKLAQTEKSRLSETLGPSQGGKNVQVSKMSPPALGSAPLGDNQSHNLVASPQANKNSSGQPLDTKKDSVNNNFSHTSPSSNCNSITSDVSDNESASKSNSRERKLYTKQYEKNVNDNLKKNQSNHKVEKELKPSNSDQSLQQNVNKEHKHYVFMTEKQKMEALNKKFSGSDLFIKKKPTSDEVKSPPTSDHIAKQKESEKLNRITNPWKKPNSVEPDFEDESISELNGSTAEDVTQDLSMDSDSKIIAVNIAECEHLMKLKYVYVHLRDRKFLFVLYLFFISLWLRDQCPGL